LLDPDEPSPILELRRHGRSPFVIIVDHAGSRIPRRLTALGLSPCDLTRHIAWDIGALEVAQQVSAALDAVLVAQNYSRLVIDCNRWPHGPTSIPATAESTAIPGNLGLTADAVDARRREIFEPYHEHIRVLLDRREREKRPTILIGQHSMTDVLGGIRRDMHAAVVYGSDRRLAGALLEILRREPGLTVADNEPYSGDDLETCYTRRNHGEARQLLHVELEIRQDLIGTEAGQAEWAQRIASALRAVELKFPFSDG
jgi:predicted N-formylglutamate amidohydrolase